MFCLKMSCCNCHFFHATIRHLQREYVLTTQAGGATINSWAVKWLLWSTLVTVSPYFNSIDHMHPFSLTCIFTLLCI